MQWESKQHGLHILSKIEFVFLFTSAYQGERDGFLQSSSGQHLQPAMKPTLPSKAKRELVTESDISAAHSRAKDCFSALNGYLRPFRIVIELFHHIHPLFGIDRAIHCGALQPQALQVHSHNFEHAHPLRDNHTGERTGNSQPALYTGTVWSLQCLTQGATTTQAPFPTANWSQAPSQFRNRGVVVELAVEDKYSINFILIDNFHLYFWILHFHLLTTNLSHNTAFSEKHKNQYQHQI